MRFIDSTCAALTMLRIFLAGKSSQTHAIVHVSFHILTDLPDRFLCADLYCSTSTRVVLQ